MNTSLYITFTLVCLSGVSRVEGTLPPDVQFCKDALTTCWQNKIGLPHRTEYFAAFDILLFQQYQPQYETLCSPNGVQNFNSALECLETVNAMDKCTGIPDVYYKYYKDAFEYFKIVCSCSPTDLNTKMVTAWGCAIKMATDGAVSGHPNCSAARVADGCVKRSLGSCYDKLLPTIYPSEAGGLPRPYSADPAKPDQSDAAATVSGKYLKKCGLSIGAGSTLRWSLLPFLIAFLISCQEVAKRI